MVQIEGYFYGKEENLENLYVDDVNSFLFGDDLEGFVESFPDEERLVFKYSIESSDAFSLFRSICLDYNVETKYILKDFENGIFIGGYCNLLGDQEADELTQEQYENAENINKVLYDLANDCRSRLDYV